MNLAYTLPSDFAQFDFDRLATQALSLSARSPTGVGSDDNEQQQHSMSHGSLSTPTASANGGNQSSSTAAAAVAYNLLLNSTGGNAFASAMQHSQLQQLMQQHNLFLQHQQLNELMKGQLSALQERLHLNLVHQSQLMQQLSQCKDKKLGAQLQLQIHQLTLGQQQLVQQIQMQSRHYLMQQGISNSPTNNSQTSDLQRLWQDLALGVGSSSFDGSDIKPTNGNRGGLINNSSSAGLLEAVIQQQSLQNRLSNGDLTLSHLAAQQPTHPLYQHGICLWPSCENMCDTYIEFVHHLNSIHKLDDRSTAQCRVQMQVVEQLESQVNKERTRLQAMMQHLQMKQSPDTTTSANGVPFGSDPNKSPFEKVKSENSSNDVHDDISPFRIHKQQNMMNSMNLNCTTPLTSVLNSMVMVSSGGNASGANVLSPTDSPSTPTSMNMTAASLSSQPIRRRVSDKSMLPIAAEISRNRDFYRTHDVRPPYTYASLIRQAIMESRERQLTLNEIYNWFQDTFAYFRRNAATWKNAVRHNLSLHKCFARVENVKGAVWTVDETEFYKRRPQRLSNAGNFVNGGSANGTKMEMAFNSDMLASVSSMLNPVLAGIVGSSQRVSSLDHNSHRRESEADLDSYIHEEYISGSNDDGTKEEMNEEYDALTPDDSRKCSVDDKPPSDESPNDENERFGAVGPDTMDDDEFDEEPRSLKIDTAEDETFERQRVDENVSDNNRPLNLALV